MTRRCVYASASLGVHDRRWIAALEEREWTPAVVLREAHGSDAAFAHAVAQASGGAPVLAGPLSNAALLVDVHAPVTLLSWGFDLHAPDARLDVIPRFACVIVDSSATRAIAAAAGARQVVDIPWGVDLEVFSPTGPVADLSSSGIDADAPVVLSLRAHEPLYRVGDIIEACAALPAGTRLVIGHGGSLTDELRRRATELGVDAVLLGSRPEAELPALLRRAWVYVTASEIDGTSVTLLQAMACGTPIVASANAGNVDWIDEGRTGFLFPVGDTSALRLALERALAVGAEVVGAARAEILARADWHANIARLDHALDAGDSGRA